MSQMREDSSVLGIRQASRWPPKLLKLFVCSIVLFMGLLLGVLFSLHMSNYLSTAQASNAVHVPLCHSSASLSSSSSSVNPRKLLFGSFPVRHNLSDPELLWLSSLVFHRQAPPDVKQAPPKIAFMFMTRGPLPFAPLWELFFAGHEQLFSVYVHAMPGFELDVPSTSVFYRRQIPSKDTRWGEITMCDAERRLLANALLDHSNQRFILLSESCAPLYNFTTLYKYLINSRHSFLSVFDDPGPYGRGRYSTNMLPEIGLEQWKKGSQWFEVARPAAVFIVSDTRYYAKFRDFCKPACYVDEHYFPTMLSIEMGSQLANRSLTAVDWSRGGSHPAMFGREDVTPAFLKRFRDDSNCSYNGEFGHPCFFFARKFSPNALEPLMQLLKDELAG